MGASLSEQFTELLIAKREAEAAIDTLPMGTWNAYQRVKQVVREIAEAHGGVTE